MNNRITEKLGLLIAITLLPALAPAQPFSIDWQTFAGGGGNGGAGTYSASVTIGQSIANEGTSGGQFSSSAGFWSLYATNGPTTGKPVLAVDSSPSGGLASSGRAGGPFSPSSKDYRLSNTGSGSLHWAVSTAANWITASPASGTLAAGASVTVTVSINANANSLSGGTYGEVVYFNNTDNGAGTTTVFFELTVFSGLNVSGYLLDASGPAGGPFNPVSTDYELLNLGTTPLSWTAGNSSNWVSLSQSVGTLAPGAATTVTVSINANANALGPGNYADIVSFVNVTDGVGSQWRFVKLNVSTSALPVITVQPRHFTASPGGSVTFDVTASGGSPLTYQWQHAGLDIPGRTNSTLTLSNLESFQVGHYTVRVRNAAGSVVSQAGTLALLSLTHTPPGLIGGGAIVTLLADGDIYRLEYADNPGTNNWTLLSRVPTPATLFDPTPVGTTRRFYRAMYSPLVP